MISTQNDSSPERLERLYQEYFPPKEALDLDDESSSLRQPSELEVVDSFTTYGISEDTLIQRE